MQVISLICEVRPVKDEAHGYLWSPDFPLVPPAGKTFTYAVKYLSMY